MIMADGGNIYERNVSDLTDNELSRMSAKELDEILDTLERIKISIG